MPAFVQPTSYTAGKKVTLLGVTYQPGAAVPNDVVRTLKDASALVSSRILIPNTDPHKRKTKKSTPAPVAFSPPSIRRGMATGA